MLLFRVAALLVPVVVSATVPVSALPALVSVIAWAPALNVAAPAPISEAPACWLIPAPVTDRPPEPNETEASVAAPVALTVTPPVPDTVSPLLVVTVVFDSKVRLVLAAKVTALPVVSAPVPVLVPTVRLV
ncbi:MAG: hypothetical protein WDO24_06720 [Pseudomonadota bacterium]